MIDRFRGVDRHAQLRSSIETLRIPGIQRAQLVDDPFAAATRRGIDRRVWILSGGAVAETVALAQALGKKQVDVLEKKLAALFHRDRARLAAVGNGEIGRASGRERGR